MPLHSRQQLNSVTQHQVQPGSQQTSTSCHRISFHQLPNVFIINRPDSLVRLQQLQTHKRSKRNDQQHDQYSPSITGISGSFLILDLHVEPVNITRLVSSTNDHTCAVDLQKIRILFVLSQKVIPKMLVLESNNSLSSKMRQLKLSSLLLRTSGLQEVLAHLNVLLVGHLNLVG